MEQAEIEEWDPDVTKQVKSLTAPLIKRWFRPEVRSLSRLPTTGGVLIVANHSGGMMTPDVWIFARAFYDHFGFNRPLYTLAHSGILVGPASRLLNRLGVIQASRENAAQALQSAAVLVFPGGDYDCYRPTFNANTIDFNGRTGYVATALKAGVPIVPLVSIGGQESQFFLTRGTGLAKRLNLKRFVRSEIVPLSIGFPFGVSVFLPPNLPLPTKIVAEVLDPIDVHGRFGPDPDVDTVDRHVRSVMQTALDRLARQRRFPIIG